MTGLSAQRYPADERAVDETSSGELKNTYCMCSAGVLSKTACHSCERTFRSRACTQIRCSLNLNNDKNLAKYPELLDPII
jgi:hypothetical protein